MLTYIILMKETKIIPLKKNNINKSTANILGVVREVIKKVIGTIKMQTIPKNSHWKRIKGVFPLKEYLYANLA